MVAGRESNAGVGWACMLKVWALCAGGVDEAATSPIILATLN